MSTELIQHIQHTAMWLAFICAAGFSLILTRIFPLAYLSDGWEEDQINSLKRWGIGLLLATIAFLTIMLIPLFL